MKKRAGSEKSGSFYLASRIYDETASLGSGMVV